MQGVTHCRGVCPRCGRDIAGGRRADTGDVILRRHKTPTGSWCSDGKRVNAGSPHSAANRVVQR